MPDGTYVYCLVAADRRPTLAPVPRGLPGAGRVRLLDFSVSSRPSGRNRGSRARTADMKQWLAVADAPLSRYGEAPINRGLANLDWVARAAVAHEAVVEAFMAAAAVLPMKLFTIFTSDDRALEHLHADRRRIESVLRRVKGHLELGVRMVLDRTPAPAVTKGGRLPARSGAAYLVLKKTQRDRQGERAQRTREVASELYGRLESLAAESRHRAAQDGAASDRPLLLDATFLVPRRKLAQFKRVVEREARALERDGCRLIMSGPWPPYSFVHD